MNRSVFFLIIAGILVFAGVLACKSPPAAVEDPVIEVVIAPDVVEIEAIEEIAEIVIIEPEFDIVSIFIIQADIVVTEFEAVLQIDNPNDFAIDLSSISYELYGNREFWAEGKANNILHIPAVSKGETRFRFKMNFIDNSRRLLNEVIAMRPINYRFEGTAHLQPDINNVSSFLVKFDCSGLSEVKRRAN